MTKQDPEPIERLQEIVAHPADKTFNSLHDRSLSTRRELVDDRHELASLLCKLPEKPPQPEAKEYQDYLQTQKEIQSLKQRVSQKHNELMEILKSEEKISREIQEKNL